MYRTDSYGATVDNLFTNGDPASAVPATQVDDTWLNAVQEELAGIVEGLGGALDKEDSSQIIALLLANMARNASANATVTVGSGGDYATINAALEAVSKTYPLYKLAGVTVTINLLADFVMAEQVLVRGIDLGWITITGADASTAITHTALTTDFTTADYGFASYPAFGVSKGGTLPRINQLFVMSVGAAGTKHGIMAVGAGSSADVLSGSGVQDAGNYGIFASHGAIINANSADASGAASYGIIASQGSIINANSADASGAGIDCILAIYSSTINASGADASGAVAGQGIFASHGSTINANSATASGAATYGITSSNGSTVNASSADTSSAGTYGLYVTYGSTINAYNATGTLSQTKNIATANGIIYKP